MDSQESFIEAIRKQTETLAKITRPYVITDVYPRRSVNMMYFRIRNVGYTPAFNIRIKTAPLISFRQRSSSDLNIFSHTISVIGPKEEISFFFDSAIELFKRENPILQFDVNIEYSDADNLLYQQTIKIDIDLLKNLAIELPASDKVIEELEHIHKDLEKVTRYTDHFLHEEMMKYSRESQQQDDQPSEAKDSLNK